MKKDKSQRSQEKLRVGSTWGDDISSKGNESEAKKGGNKKILSDFGNLLDSSSDEDDANKADIDGIDDDGVSVSTESTEVSVYRYFVDMENYKPKQVTPGERDEKGRLLSAYHVSPELLSVLTGKAPEQGSEEDGSKEEHSGSDSEEDDDGSDGSNSDLS